MDFLKGDALADAIGTVPNAEDLDFHRCEALFDEAEFAGDGGRDIQHAARNERASVVQANCGRASVFEIGDTDFAGEGECLVGGRAGPRPDLFACRSSARKKKPAFIVVGADAGIAIPDSVAHLHRLVVDAANGVWLCFVAFDGSCRAAGEGHEKEGKGSLK